MPAQIDLSTFHSDWIRLVDKAIFHYAELLTEDERIWFNIQSLIQGVNEGGLNDYYANYGADHLTDTMADLKTIGADTGSQLLEQMNQLFPGGSPPADIDERNNVMDTWDEDETIELINELEEKFNNEEAELENKLIAHILSKGLNITS